jgi:hypothetical protein
MVNQNGDGDIVVSPLRERILLDAISSSSLLGSIEVAKESTAEIAK